MKMIKCAVLVMGMQTAMASMAESSVAVVVSKSIQIDTSAVTREAVANVFLGKISTLPGGQELKPLDQEEGKPARVEFYSKVTGKAAVQVRAYWATMVFTGRGTPPEAVTDDQAVLDHVANDPTSIGYVDAELAKSSDDVQIIYSAE